MRILGNLLLVLSTCLLISCKSSGVTLEKLKAQEAEAREELVEVREELTKLAQMKEQYSIDNKKALLKSMRNRLDAIDVEMDKLKSVTKSDNDEAKKAAKKGLSSLKDEEQQLRSKIEKVEVQPEENWAASVETINQGIAALERELNKIMQNVNGQ